MILYNKTSSTDIEYSVVAKGTYYGIIIVVIITWPVKKNSLKNNSDITVIRVSDLLKWLMFMQNFEHGVTVFNQ